MLKTKIVCTIGPSSWDPSIVEEMVNSGMNVARVNGAFADTDELDKVLKLVRNISDDVALMLDVKGPEVRLNKFLEPLRVTPGENLIIGNSEADSLYPANYPNLYKSVSVGQRIIFGDGDVEVVVKRIDDGKMYCQVIYGEYIKPGKALNLPGCEYSKEVLTLKDKENLTHAMKTGWDIVAASFIRNAKSARTIKEFISSSNMKLIAKIEDAEGIENLEEILPEVNGIMIARGGLGLELGLEKIPLVQSNLIKRLNIAGLPVITATQMLESMHRSPKPTRAEATDVANAILLGTDAVMLSGESAMGRYPVESVKMISQIANEVEKNIEPVVLKERANAPLTTEAITKAAAEVCISMDKDLDSVIVVSKTGTTARLLARHGIKQPIYVFTSTEANKRALMLTKCIERAFLFEGLKGKASNYNRDSAIRIILKQALKEGAIKKNQKILFLGKTPVDKEEFFPNLFEIIKI
jgi:pyruvate kinase